MGKYRGLWYSPTEYFIRLFWDTETLPFFLDLAEGWWGPHLHFQVTSPPFKDFGPFKTSVKSLICLILLYDSSCCCPIVILVHSAVQEPLGCRDMPAKVSYPIFFAKTHNLCQRFALASKIFYQNTKVAYFIKPMYNCKVWIQCRISSWEL